MGYGNNWKPLKHSAICSRHFKPTDFRMNTNIPRLLPDAVPTIKVNDASSKLHIEDQPVVSESEIEISHEELVINDDYLIGDLDKICGLCGKEYKFVLKNVSQNNEFNEKKLFDYLNFSLNINKHLPISMCSRCENKLNEFERFILQIKKTQEKLSKRFHEYEINENIIEETNQMESSSMYENYELSPHSKQQISSKENNTPKSPTITNIPDSPTKTVRHTFMIPLGDYFSPNTEFCPNVKMCIAPASNIEIQPSQDPEMLVPIKMEMMTPCNDSNKTRLSKMPSKKIKILQDIKIDPQQILVNPLRDESLLKNKSKMTNAEKVKLPNKTTNINMDLKTMSLLSNSMAICQYCDERFVSRYALNHHIKYLCKNAVSSVKSLFASCVNCKKSFSCDMKLKSHLAKCNSSGNSLNKISKRRRKPTIVMKRQTINNCSYLVGYDLKSKTLLNV